MAPEPRCHGNAFIPVGRKELDKLIVCKPAGLREALHAAPDFDKNLVVVNEGEYVVLVDNDGRNHSSGNAHVFITVHRRPEMKSFMSVVRNLAFLVDRTLLINSFGVVRSAVLVLTLNR